ncbi:MAG: hypothetical protein MUE94_12710 [Verrucomicrobia bacterium]|jgi:hypothetical protein|nr:hypothetical protein [Verrucomicrobiota bacterium]
MHVPEAFERFQLVEKLAQIRRKRGGTPAVWGAGLSTAEVQWQIEMDEKYGGDALPEKEVKAREAARKREETSRKKHDANVLAVMQPLYPEA